MSVAISVLTPTIRGLKALKPIEQSLAYQTFDSWEWLVEIGDGRTCDLNAAFNRMLRRARGELVVFIEDWVWFVPDALQRFWDAYQSMPKTFFTAPVPKAAQYWTDARGVVYFTEPLEPEWRSSTPGGIDWAHWEIDFGAAPLAALKEIGGFDEALDKYWGCDNWNASYRAHLAGYKFFNVIDNPAVALKHDALFAHPFRDKYNPEFAKERLKDFDTGLKLTL